MLSVSDFLVDYPTIDSPSFQHDINTKAEFYNNSLSPTEPLSEKKGKYFRHQEMARRLINNETPYSKMLFEHDPGTGKTCIIAAIAEANKHMVNTPIVFVSSQIQELNLKKTISRECLPGKYLDVTDEDISQRVRNRGYTSLINQDFEFKTLQKFSHKIMTTDNSGERINNMSDESIIEMFSNRLIIIDEAHRVRQTVEQDSVVYEAFWRLLHVAKDLKVILLSGTPESDKARDFAYTMNLILPEDEQLPETDYDDIMFDEDELSSEGKEMLKKAVTGRVSYLRGVITGEVRVIENGQLNPWGEDYEDWRLATRSSVLEDEVVWTKGMKVVPLRMSPFQERILRESSTKREVTRTGKEGVEGGAFSSFEKEAAIFVWGDGSYGSEGFRRHVKSTGMEQTTAMRRLGLRAGRTSYEFKTREIRNDVRDNLQKYSAKFYYIIEKLRELTTKGGKAFIFSPFIENGNLMLLTMIMKLVLGYREGGEITDWERASKTPRFVILSGSSGEGDNAMIRLIDTFNHPNNKRGEYINVILGTEKISEGITLKGIREYFSFRADHRRKFILQAERRGARIGSHSQLPEAEKTMTVNRLVAAYSDGDVFAEEPTRDIQIYRQIEQKNAYISEQKRFRKIHAVDCVWNYRRNVQTTDTDYTAECDNMMCNYVCADMDAYVDRNQNVWRYILPEDEIDYTNYNLLYAEADEEEIIAKARFMFQDKASYTFDELKAIFDRHNPELILRTFVRMVHDSIGVFSSFGLVVYLSQKEDTFYIPENNTLNINTQKSLKDANSDIVGKRDIRLFCECTSDEERLEVLKTLKGKVLTDFVEVYVELAETKTFSATIREFFNRFVFVMRDGKIVHYLNIDTYDYYSFGGKIRITEKSNVMYYDGAWIQAPPDIKRRFVTEFYELQKSNAETRLGGASAYGVRDKTGDKTKFKLTRNITMESICLFKNDADMVSVVAKLGIPFDGYPLSRVPFDRTDVPDSQVDNVKRMLGLLRDDRIETCRIITTFIRNKHRELADVRPFKTRKDVSLNEARGLVQNYAMGGTSTPQLLKTLADAWAKGNGIKRFHKIVSLYIENIQVWYNAYNSNTTGSVCIQLHKSKMLRTLMDVMKPEDMRDMGWSRKEMLDEIDALNTGYHPVELSRMTDPQLNMIVYIFDKSTRKTELCEFLYDALEKRNLMFDN